MWLAFVPKTLSRKFFSATKASSHSLSTTSFYDSQSGKVVELSNVVRLWNLQAFESKTKEFSCSDASNAAEIPDANSSASIAFIKDAYSSQSDALSIQLLSGILGDKGYSRIILGTSLEDANYYENQMDEDMIHEFIQECLWNDIDAPPMSERLGLRVIPNHTNQDLSLQAVEAALEANLKNFCVCSAGGSRSISVDLCRDLLDAKNIDFEYIEK